MSRPAASASRCASVAAVNEMKWSRLRASFIRVPAPTSPAWTTSSANRPNGSRTAANASSGPPTITARRPCWAPGAPPLTGASIRWTPASAQVRASSTAVTSEIVECTAITVPARAVDRMPSGPATTSRTWASSSTVTEITVASAATAAAVAAPRAPAAVNGSAASGRASQTTRPPGQSSSRSAIGAPMLPSPM